MSKDKLRIEVTDRMDSLAKAGGQAARLWFHEASYADRHGWSLIASETLPEMGRMIDAPPLPDDVVEEWDELRINREFDAVPLDEQERHAFALGFYEALRREWDDQILALSA